MSAFPLSWPSGEITVVANTEKGLIGVKAPTGRRIIIPEFSITCGGTDPAALAARVRAVVCHDAQSGEISFPSGTTANAVRMGGLFDQVQTTLLVVGSTGVKDFTLPAPDANWILLAGEDYIHQQGGNWLWRPAPGRKALELTNGGMLCIGVLAAAAIKVSARIEMEE